MDLIKSAVQGWISHEPVASLWLAVVAVALFGVTVARSQPEDAAGWVWGRRLIDALVKALVFICLLGGVYFLLNSDYAAFSQIYGSFTTRGSLSNLNWQQWQSRYGGPQVQQDLQIAQYVTVETQEAIPPADPSQPVLFRTVKVDELVQQNSLLGFRGQVTMTMADPGPNDSAFSAYGLEALYEYDVVDPADSETRAEFKFPLSSEAKLYQDVWITVDGVELTTWNMASNAIVWDDHLRPGQKATVAIHFSSRGMDSYLFEIPEPREVINFTLTVALDGIYGTRTEPAGSSLHLEETPAPPYRRCTWTVGRAVMAPTMGVDLRQHWPYAPYQAMVTVLPQAARASVLFLALATLTLLICGAPVSLWQIALLAGLFPVPFLPLLAGGLPTPAWVTPAQLAAWQVKMLPVLSVVPLILALLALRKLPRLPLALTLLLMALFMGSYAFINFVPEEQKRNAIESLVQAGMIAYVFALVLFVRVRSLFRPKP